MQGLLSYQADSGDPASEVIYTLNSTPSVGFLYNTNVSTTTPLAVGDSFTQADIDNGLIVYTNDATSSASDDSDGFSFTVTDGAAGAVGTFGITINEATPTLVTNAGLTVFESNANVSLQGLLSYQADAGDPTSEVVYTLTAVPAHGSLYNTNVSTTIALGVGDTFTQADLDSGFITYTNDGLDNASDGFAFTVTDDNSAAAVDSFSITINEGTPTVVTNAGLTVNEGCQCAASGPAHFPRRQQRSEQRSTLHADIGAVFRLPVQHQRFFNDASGHRHSFTQADIDSGFIVYSNDSTSNAPDSSDGFNFSVSDDNSPVVNSGFTITINEATPTVVTNAGLTVNEGVPIRRSRACSAIRRTAAIPPARWFTR